MGRARLEHRLRAKAEATIQPGLALRRLTAWASTIRCLRACRRSSSRPSLQNRRLARLRLGAQRQEDQRQRHEYHHHQLVSALVGMRPRVVHEGLQLGRLLLEEDLLDVDWIETFSCSAGGGQRGYAHLGLARTRYHALSCDLRPSATSTIGAAAQVRTVDLPFTRPRSLTSEFLPQAGLQRNRKPRSL